MDAPTPPPPHSPSFSSAEVFFFLAQWAGLVLIFPLLPNGCGKTAAQPAGEDHALILQLPEFTSFGLKRKQYRGIYRSRDLNPAHQTSTMKIPHLIFKARLRCTVKLLLLLTHCVGLLHGMPHVLRFGKLLLFCLLFKSFTAVFSPHKWCCSIPTCWGLAVSPCPCSALLTVICRVPRNLA